VNKEAPRSGRPGAVVLPERGACCRNEVLGQAPMRGNGFVEKTTSTETSKYSASFSAK
jgi:hypothetical protein